MKNKAKSILSIYYLIIMLAKLFFALLAIVTALFVLIGGKDAFGAFYIYSSSLFFLLSIISFLCGLIGLIFKKSRQYGGLLILFSSCFYFYGFWLWGTVISLSYAGIFWLLIGILFVGLGVFGVSIISLLLNLEFFYLFIIVVNFLVYYGLVILANYFIGDEKKLALESNVIDYVNYEAEIIQEIERLEKNPPLVLDSQLLPSSKGKILSIIEEKLAINEDLSSKVIFQDADYLLPLLDKEFDKLNGKEFFIKNFVFFENKQDRQAFDKINRKYKSWVQTTNANDFYETLLDNYHLISELINVYRDRPLIPEKSLLQFKLREYSEALTSAKFRIETLEDMNGYKNEELRLFSSTLYDLELFLEKLVEVNDSDRELVDKLNQTYKNIDEIENEELLDLLFEKFGIY